MKERNMKLNKFANLLVIGLVVCVAASGCKKKPVGVTELPGAKAGKPSEVPDTGRAQSETTPTGSDGTPAAPILREALRPTRPTCIQGWLEDAQALKAETVYFDFDSSVIKASEKPKVAAVADYLKANKGKAVRVEGNCDERGTEEYNRSLGERRALAVREELIRLGIGPTEVDTISYGKDRPAAQGHDEAAWKLNRRDDFIVLSPPARKRVELDPPSFARHRLSKPVPLLLWEPAPRPRPARCQSRGPMAPKGIRRVSEGFPRFRWGFPRHSHACFGATRATLPSPSTSWTAPADRVFNRTCRAIWLCQDASFGAL